MALWMAEMMAAYLVDVRDFWSAEKLDFLLDLQKADKTDRKLDYWLEQ